MASSPVLSPPSLDVPLPGIHGLLRGPALPAPSTAVPAQGHRGGWLDWEGAYDAVPAAGHADPGPRAGLRLLLHAVSSEGAPVPPPELGCAPYSARSERTRTDRQTGHREVAGDRQAGCALWAGQGMAPPAGQRGSQDRLCPGPATRRPLAPHVRWEAGLQTHAGPSRAHWLRELPEPCLPGAVPRGHTGLSPNQTPSPCTGSVPATPEPPVDTTSQADLP